MSKKALILCLVSLGVLIALTVTGVALLYKDGPDKSAAPARMVKTPSGYRLLEAVPSDAVMLLSSKSTKEATRLLTDSTRVFSALLTDNGKRGFSTFLEKIKDIPYNQPAVVSLHYSGELMPLMIIEARADTTYDIASIMSAADSVGLKFRMIGCGEKTSESSPLHKLTLMEISPSETLISSSVRHIENGVSILENDAFDMASEKAGGADAIFVCHDYASKIFAAHLRKPFYGSWEFFGKMADWSAWVIKDSEVQALFPEDSRFFPVVTGRSAEVKLPEVLPATTFFAVSVPVADISSFMDTYKGWMDADGSLNRWLSKDKAMKDSTGITPSKWVSKLDVKEVAKATIRTAKGLSPIVLIRPGKEDADIILRGSLLSSFKEYKGAVLPYAWKGYASQVFGDLFSCADERFFTYSQGWIIVGDQATISEYASGEMLKYSLKQYCSDNDVTLSRTAGALCWFSPTEARDMLGKIFETNMEKALRKTLEGISAEPYTFALNGRVATFASKRIRVQQVNSSLAASADTTVEIPSGPFKVSNSATGKTNLFGQAPNLTLTFKEENGKSVWGVPFKGKLCGRVQEIDYYANGKLQYLFASGSNLYLIDRLGRFVSPFPVALPKEVLLGPDVYDFTGAKGYSAMVLHKDNSLGLYDLHGRVRQGWEGIAGKDTIKDLPELISVKGKKFWVVRTSSRTDIYPFGGGEALTKAEGDKAFRHDSPITIKDGSVSGTCYDGKSRNIKLVK